MSSTWKWSKGFFGGLFIGLIIMVVAYFILTGGGIVDTGDVMNDAIIAGLLSVIIGFITWIFAGIGIVIKTKEKQSETKDSS